MFVCAAIAILNGTAWALLTPPYQVPDEIGHAGYTQYFAETGKLPRPGGQLARYRGGTSLFSEEVLETETALRFSTEGRPSWSRTQDTRLRRVLSGKLERTSERGAADAVNNPPLYYVLDAIPYRLGHAANYLDRLFLMRMLSVLLAEVAPAFVFLFVLDIFARLPLLVSARERDVAVQLLLGFVS